MTTGSGERAGAAGARGGHGTGTGPAAGATIGRAGQAAGGGKYVLFEKIGDGGFGEVWTARRTGAAGGLLVVKLATGPEGAVLWKTDPKRVPRWLAYPRIVQTYEVGIDDDPVRYIAEELVENGPVSLRSLLRFRGGKLPPTSAGTVARDVAEALRYAHDRGVVHGHVRPEAVLVTGDGRAHVAEFGIGMGAAGATAPDPQADVAALGAMLAAMVDEEGAARYGAVIEKCRSGKASAAEVERDLEAIVGAAWWPGKGPGKDPFLTGGPAPRPPGAEHPVETRLGRKVPRRGGAAEAMTEAAVGAGGGGNGEGPVAANEPESSAPAPVTRRAAATSERLPAAAAEPTSHHGVAAALADHVSEAWIAIVVAVFVLGALIVLATSGGEEHPKGGDGAHGQGHPAGEAHAGESER